MVPIVAVGNKIDRAEKRQVTKEQAELWCKEKKIKVIISIYILLLLCPAILLERFRDHLLLNSHTFFNLAHSVTQYYYEVSAKTNDNIQETFLDIANHILNSEDFKFDCIPCTGCTDAFA